MTQAIITFMLVFYRHFEDSFRLKLRVKFRKLITLFRYDGIFGSISPRIEYTVCSCEINQDQTNNNGCNEVNLISLPNVCSVKKVKAI